MGMRTTAWSHVACSVAGIIVGTVLGFYLGFVISWRIRSQLLVKEDVSGDTVQIVAVNRTVNHGTILSESNLALRAIADKEVGISLSRFIPSNHVREIIGNRFGVIFREANPYVGQMLPSHEV